MLVSADTCASKIGSIVRSAVRLMEVGWLVVVVLDLRLDSEEDGAKRFSAFAEAPVGSRVLWLEGKALLSSPEARIRRCRRFCLANFK